MFGFFEAAVLRLQVQGIEVSSYLLACLPYVASLLLVIVVQMTLGILRKRSAIARLAPQPA